MSPRRSPLRVFSKFLENQGNTINQWIVTFRWWVVCTWILAAAGILFWGPMPDPTPGESGNLLPSNTPAQLAVAAMATHFTSKSELSDVVVGFERADSSLTPADLQIVEKVAHEFLHPPKSVDSDLVNASIRTPASFALAGNANPLISADGHAALIIIGLPCGYITRQAARVAKQIQDAAIKYPNPRGLSIFVTRNCR